MRRGSTPAGLRPSGLRAAVYAPRVYAPRVYAPNSFVPGLESNDKFRDAFSAAQNQTLLVVSANTGSSSERHRVDR